MGVERSLKINHIGNELFLKTGNLFTGRRAMQLLLPPFGPKETGLWAKQEKVWFLSFSAGVSEHSDHRLLVSPALKTSQAPVSGTYWMTDKEV